MSEGMSAGAPGGRREALYNRYRPTRFSEVRGQGDVVKALRHGVETGKLAPSMIFEGMHGTGKTSVARILARVLNCASPIDGDLCGKCESCKLPVHETMGLFELDGASNSGVVAMRELADQISNSASLAKARVFIIDEAQEVNTGAVPAILKAFEEPPPGTYIILCTTNPEVIISTIRSRAVKYSFSSLEDEELASLVRDVTKAEGCDPLPEEVVESIVARGSGSPRDTLSELELVLMGGSVSSVGRGVELADGILTSDVASVVKAIAEGARDGSSMQLLSSEAMGRMRNIMLADMAPGEVSKARLNEIEERFGESLPKVASLAITAISGLADVQKSLRFSSDPRSVLEAACISLSAPSSNSLQDGALARQLAEVMSELNRISSKLDELVRHGAPAVSATKDIHGQVEWPGVDDSPTSPAAKGREEVFAKNDSGSSEPEPDRFAPAVEHSRSNSHGVSAEESSPVPPSAEEVTSFVKRQVALSRDPKLEGRPARRRRLEDEVAVHFEVFTTDEGAFEVISDGGLSDSDLFALLSAIQEEGWGNVVVIDRDEEVKLDDFQEE